MPKIAFIGGSNFNPKDILKGFQQKIIKTMYGNVLLFRKGKVYFLPRHGKNKNIPPHRVNHKANICALNLEGVEKIYSVTSVYPLKEAIKSGALIVPDDYVNFSPDSFIEFELKLIEPEINKKVSKEIKDAAKKAKLTTKNTGVFVQIKGPRIATKAELKILKKWGDILGMTVAVEATLSKELGIPYAALCTVDKKPEQTCVKVTKIIKEIMRKNK